MSIGGWFIFLIAVGSVLTLFCWCMYKVITTPGETEHLHRIGEHTPDEEA